MWDKIVLLAGAAGFVLIAAWTILQILATAPR